jgi:hypothetical protein
VSNAHCTSLGRYELVWGDVGPSTYETHVRDDIGQGLTSHRGRNEGRLLMFLSRTFATSSAMSHPNIPLHLSSPIHTSWLFVQTSILRCQISQGAQAIARLALSSNDKVSHWILQSSFFFSHRMSVAKLDWEAVSARWYCRVQG